MLHFKHANSTVLARVSGTPPHSFAGALVCHLAHVHPSAGTTLLKDQLSCNLLSRCHWLSFPCRTTCAPPTLHTHHCCALEVPVFMWHPPPEWEDSSGTGTLLCSNLTSRTSEVPGVGTGAQQRWLNGAELTVTQTFSTTALPKCTFQEWKKVRPSFYTCSPLSRAIGEFEIWVTSFYLFIQSSIQQSKWLHTSQYWNCTVSASTFDLSSS